MSDYLNNPPDLTHQDLLKAFEEAGLSEIGGMRILTDSNAISDLCIEAKNVAYADIPAAIEAVKRWHAENP